MNLRPLLVPIAAAILVATALYGEEVVKPDPVDDGKVVVTYWEKWTNFEGEAMRKVVDEFNNRQDKIFVRYLNISNIAQKTIMAISGGSPPDVAGLYGPNTAQYAYNNAIIPLDELAYEAGIKKEDYIDVYWDMCMYKGRLWAMPTAPASTALHINRSMLASAGLDPDDPPTTISELDAMDAAIYKKEGSRILTMGFLPTEPGWWPWAWPYFFGGDLWDGESKITMTRPENIEAYAWVASYPERYGPTAVTAYQQGFGGFDSPQNGFLDEKLGTVLQGVWMSNFIGNHNPTMDWAAVPFPHPDGKPELKNPTVIDLDILVIPRGAKHPKEAFEFIKFATSQEGQELLGKGQKKHTPMVRVSPEFIANHENPYVSLFSELAHSPNAYTPPKTPLWPLWGQEIRSAYERINLGEKGMTRHQLAERELNRVQNKMQPIMDQITKAEKVRGYGKPNIPEGYYE